MEFNPSFWESLPVPAALATAGMSTSQRQLPESLGLFTHFLQRNVSAVRSLDGSTGLDSGFGALPTLTPSGWEQMEGQLASDDLRELDSFDLDGLLSAAGPSPFLTDYDLGKAEQSLFPLYAPSKAFVPAEPTQRLQPVLDPFEMSMPAAVCPVSSTTLDTGPVDRRRTKSRGKTILPDSAPREAARSKRPRHFWQYNVQAKGPKRDVTSRRSSSASEVSDGGLQPHDPHVLPQAVDPVFNWELGRDDEQPGVRIKHTGKARRGDGNDLTPNVRKLLGIGRELDAINGAIEALGGETDEDSLGKAARREKNKLSSRGCRLKKKAQHEANKIKLQGLEDQHRELMETLTVARQSLLAHASSTLATTGGLYPACSRPESATELLRRIKDKHLRTFVAGRSTDYVNEQLQVADKSDSSVKHRV